MARATRIALDLALVSLSTVGPVVSNIWSATKRLLINTPGKPLVCNPLIRRAEDALDKLASMLVSKITNLRDRQLPAEAKYLEKELEKVKKKIGQKGDSASKSLKPGCEIAWRYAKVEMIPPGTQIFFHGPGGQKMEEAVSKMADNLISGLEQTIRDIEAEKERQIKAKEAAIKAAEEKAKAEAKKREEQMLKEKAAMKAKAAEKAKQAAEKEKAKAATTAVPKAAATAAPKPDSKSDKLNKADEKVAKKGDDIKKNETTKKDSKPKK